MKLQTLREDRLHEIGSDLIVEELIGTFISFPHIFRDYRNNVDKTTFQDMAWLFEIMCQVDDDEGLTYKGIINRIPLPQIKLVQELRNMGYNERRAPILLKQLADDKTSSILRDIGLDLLGRITLGEDPNELIRHLQGQMDNVYTVDTMNLKDMKKQVDAYAARMMAIVKDPSLAYGIMTGMSDLDNITTGWHRKEMSVVGARTSMGKTAFMLENINRINDNGYKCAVFSLEMDNVPMYDRLMANKMEVNLKAYRFGRLAPNHYQTMLRRKVELETIYLEDLRGLSADSITDTMRRLKRTQGLDFVVVDYLQDVNEKNEASDNQGEKLARVCRKLRKAAKDCDCHVMGLSQVTRASEKQVDKRPANSDLSGSTGIETSADVIALLYREDYYDRNTDKKNVLEVNFTKQRNGEVGTVELKYDRSTQRITSLDR